MASLYSCTRCHGRHPFEELSQGEQLCKECRNNFPIVKCTFCRAEFQQEEAGEPNSVCRKCAKNVKSSGKPTACMYCNIIAAFDGNKCQRCLSCEKRYGPPQTCEQCKQKCAFERSEESRKKVDDKLLCWLCTSSYRRILARAKAKKDDLQEERGEAGGSKEGKDKHHRHKSSHHKHHHDKDRHHKSKTHHGDSKSHSHSEADSKKSKVDVTKPPKVDVTKPASSSNGVTGGSRLTMDAANIGDPSSDHFIALSQLREEVEQLKRQVRDKEGQLLEKDKKLGENKAIQFEKEKEWRIKLTATQKEKDSQIDLYQNLQAVNRKLEKQIKDLQKSSNKNKVSSPAIQEL